MKEYVLQFPVVEVDPIVLEQRVVGVFDFAALSDATATPVGGESLVQQHFAEEVDINTIMRRFGVTGQLPFGPATGVYGDFTGISDYESAVERVEGARERFMAMPPEIREKFENDPGKLIAAAESMPAAEFDALFVPPEAVLPAAPVVPAAAVV